MNASVNVRAARAVVGAVTGKGGNCGDDETQREQGSLHKKISSRFVELRIERRYGSELCSVQ